jgi:histidinol phosphatase-like PHP family hydrolase
MYREVLGLPRVHDYHVHSVYSDGTGSIRSIADACVANDCFELAYTDHVDEHGEFIFCTAGERRSIKDYISEIRGIQWSRAATGLHVHPGIELTVLSGDVLDAIEADLVPQVDGLDLVLFDGPIDIVLGVRNALDNNGFVDLPLIVAHPDYTGFSVELIESFMARDIIFELNNAKISPAQRQGVERLLEIAETYAFGRPRFMLGSDAHASADAGIVDIVAQFALDLNIALDLLFLDRE